jgi:hypothetical protein
MRTDLNAETLTARLYIIEILRNGVLTPFGRLEVTIHSQKALREPAKSSGCALSKVALPHQANQAAAGSNHGDANISSYLFKAS